MAASYNYEYPFVNPHQTEHSMIYPTQQLNPLYPLHNQQCHYMPQLLKQAGVPLNRVDPTYFYVSRACFRRFVRTRPDGQSYSFYRFVKSRNLRCVRIPSARSYTIYRGPPLLSGRSRRFIANGECRYAIGVEASFDFTVGEEELLS